MLHPEEKIALLLGFCLGATILAACWVDSLRADLAKTEAALWAVSKRNRRLVEIIDTAADRISPGAEAGD